jgi:hypothetical protein
VTLAASRWGFIVETRRLARDWGRAFVDQANNPSLIEIDDRQKPLNRPPPDIGLAQRPGKASYPDQTASRFSRIGRIPGRKRGAEHLAEIIEATLAHRLLPVGIDARDLPSKLYLLVSDGALDIGDRLPTLDPLCTEGDHGLIYCAVAARDDEGLANEWLPRLPGEHISLDRLIEVDQRIPSGRVRITRALQHGYNSPDLGYRQWVERVWRSVASCAGGQEQ